MTAHLQDEVISLDHIRLRQMVVCVLHTEHKPAQTYTENSSFIVSQHCNFMLINSVP
jgi:hypothetical protein